jgi:hypothetical protein
MKRAVLGSLLVLGLVMVAVAVGQQRGDGISQRGAAVPAAASGTELIVVPTPLGEKGQMLTVVDARQRVLSVYHIDLTGKVALRSVRNITWDLQMEHYNNENPLPREIRSLLEQR